MRADLFGYACDVFSMPDSKTTIDEQVADAVDEQPPAVAAPAPSGPPKLRPYQVALVNDLYRELNEGYKRVAIIAGTGGGKTVFCSDSMVIILRNSASFFGLDIILILIINFIFQCDRHQFQISCSRYLCSTITNTKRSDSRCCQKSQRDIKVCL